MAERLDPHEQRSHTHQVETIMGYLGLQDATKKHRPHSQAPGEWNGSKTRTIEGVGLLVTVSQETWDRAKSMSSIKEYYADGALTPIMELKDSEYKVDFLVHLTVASFLKGFYLTMNSWRPIMDGNGWKMSRQAHEAFIAASEKGFDTL